MSQTWSHHRAQWFFSHARWSLEEVSAVLAGLVVRLLAAKDAAVTVAIDDTLFDRRGPKVHAASWFHDGSTLGDKKIGYGNNWVISAIVVRLGFLDRPVALPVGFGLVRKDSDDSSRLALARRLVEALAAALPGRTIHVVADAAYAGKALRDLSRSVTWTTRLRSNASLYELAPARTGRRGRPAGKGCSSHRLLTSPPALPSSRPRSLDTAQPRPSRQPRVPAFAMACSAHNRCSSCSSGTGRGAATTWRSSPPTSMPPPLRSSSATPRAGQSRSPSRMRSSSGAPARLATGSSRPSSARSPLGSP